MPPPDNPSFSPSSRSFAHHNLSNPNISWGGKFERHCLLGLTSSSQNFLIGDSSIERLSRPALLPLAQAKLPGWTNYGIGGDHAQNVWWRLQHGGMPENAGKCIISIGSNNIRSNNHKHCQKIANTILSTASYLLDNHPQIELAVVGIFPRENDTKCRAATTINNIVSYKLPPRATFIVPPTIFSTRAGTPKPKFYETDLIHLNDEGYRILLDSLASFINTPLHSQPCRVNPFTDDFGIGEPEFLGSGWDSQTPPPPPYAPPPYSTQTPPTAPLTLPMAPPTTLVSLSLFPPLPPPAPCQSPHKRPFKRFSARPQKIFTPEKLHSRPPARLWQATPVTQPKSACQPAPKKKLPFFYQKTTATLPRGSLVRHSLADQFRRKAPKATPKAPYTHIPPNPMPRKEDPISLPEPNWQPTRKPARLKPLPESKVPLATQQPPVVQPSGLHPPFVHPTAATPQMETLTEIGNPELPNLVQNNVKNTHMSPLFSLVKHLPATLLLISVLALLVLTVSITTWPASHNFINFA